MVVVVIFIGVLIFWLKGRSNTKVVSKTNTKEVTIGDINVKISGSGVIEPLERYAITPLVYGNIEECDFEETDLIPSII